MRQKKIFEESCRWTQLQVLVRYSQNETNCVFFFFFFFFFFFHSVDLVAVEKIRKQLLI